MKYYLIVGEASGDLHASHLMQSLKNLDADAQFRFFGGDMMKAVGGTCVRHYRDLAYMGFVPVLLHLPTILSNMRMCKDDIAAWQPDCIILVDYPGFNLKIAKFVKSRTNTPVYYYISPKIWAWKEYRIKNIKRDVDELFSILPFEVVRNTSVRGKRNLFCASLSAKPGSVCVSMIENIPVITDLHNASVIICSVCCGFISFFISIDMHIAVTYDYSAVLKRSLGTLGCCIAKLVHNF